MKKNKKGVLGLDTVKAFMLIILVVVVILFSMVIALSSLRDAAENVEPTTTNTIVNETLTAANDTVFTPTSVTGGEQRKETCAITSLNNASGGEDIPVSNFTFDTTLCTITMIGGTFNATDVNITFSNNFLTSSAANEVLTNISGGALDFVGNTSTWFSLLSVLIVILIISVVIMAVNRFGGGGSRGGL